MRQNYSKSEKKAITNRYDNGEPVATISAETGIPRSTIYAWIKNATADQNAITPKTFAF